MKRFLALFLALLMILALAGCAMNAPAANDESTSLEPAQAAQEALGLQPGDKIVLTGGTVNGTSGNTNLIKVESI